MAATVVHDVSRLDFESPGKRHYQLAFHLDGTWGYSLVPLTVIVGARGENTNGVACFGGTHVILMPQLSESACQSNRRESPLDGAHREGFFS